MNVYLDIYVYVCIYIYIVYTDEIYAHVQMLSEL